MSDYYFSASKSFKLLSDIHNLFRWPLTGDQKQNKSLEPAANFIWSQACKSDYQNGLFFWELKQLSGWKRPSDKRDKNKRQNNKLADHENPKCRCGSLKSERKCDDNALIEHKKGLATGWVRVKRIQLQLQKRQHKINSYWESLGGHCSQLGASVGRWDPIPLPPCKCLAYPCAWTDYQISVNVIGLLGNRRITDTSSPAHTHFSCSNFQFPVKPLKRQNLNDLAETW